MPLILELEVRKNQVLNQELDQLDEVGLKKWEAEPANLGTYALRADTTTAHHGSGRHSVSHVGRTTGIK